MTTLLDLLRFRRFRTRSPRPPGYGALRRREVEPCRAAPKISPPPVDVRAHLADNTLGNLYEPPASGRGRPHPEGGGHDGTRTEESVATRCRVPGIVRDPESGGARRDRLR